MGILSEKDINGISDNIVFMALFVVLSVLLCICLTLFFDNKKVNKPAGYVLLFSMFIYILNPSVISQLVLKDFWRTKFYNSMFNFLIMYVNFFGAIYLAIDVVKGRNKFSFMYYIFIFCAVYQFVNPDIVLYCWETKNNWLNYVSMAGYCVFIPLYCLLILKRLLSCIIEKQKIEFVSITEFVFMSIIGFPSAVFSRTSLIANNNGIIDFWGYRQGVKTSIFDSVYWIIIVSVAVISALYLLYYYKLCPDKRAFVYNSVLVMALTTYLRRATFFYQNSFGLMILLDSACAFMIAAYLLFLKFDKKLFGYIVGFFSAPSAIIYLCFYVGIGIENSLFTYFSFDSLIYHAAMIPIGLSVFGLDKFNSYKCVLKSIAVLAVVKVIYAFIGNLYGYIEYAYNIPLNTFDFNGFLYRQSIIYFFEPLMHIGEYVENGMIIYPLNYIVLPVLFLILESIVYASVKFYHVVAKKISLMKRLIIKQI